MAEPTTLALQVPRGVTPEGWTTFLGLMGLPEIRAVDTRTQLEDLVRTRPLDVQRRLTLAASNRLPVSQSPMPEARPTFFAVEAAQMPDREQFDQVGVHRGLLVRHTEVKQNAGECSVQRRPHRGWICALMVSTVTVVAPIKSSRLAGSCPPTSVTG